MAERLVMPLWELLVDAKKSAKKPEGWNGCGNVGMEASE